MQGGRTGDVDIAQEDLAPLGPPQADNRLGEFALTVAGHTGHPHDLGLPHFEVDLTQGLDAPITVSGQASHRQGGRARHRPGASPGGQVPPDHHPGEGGRVGFGRLHRSDPLAVPQHGHPVGDLQHLVELVGDEDDGLPVGGHGPHRHEQALSLLGGKHRGRFVQDQDANSPVQELQDLDPLLLPDRELPDGGLG